MDRIGRGRGWARRRLPFLGLVLVLAFLGHDVMMAAEPHAETAPHRSSAEPHAAAPGRLAGAAVVATSAEPGHPAGCTVVRPASPRPDNDWHPGDRTPALPCGLVASDAPVMSVDAGGAWREPRWPPGVLRALFQVYRI